MHQITATIHGLTKDTLYVAYNDYVQIFNSTSDTTNFIFDNLLLDNETLNIDLSVETGAVYCTSLHTILPLTINSDVILDIECTTSM